MTSDDRPPWRRSYKTARWAALRLEIFVRDGFRCQKCGLVEGDTSKLVCDHKVAHRGDDRLFWDRMNLQTLCKPCHDGMKQREEQTTVAHRGVWH
jgi:5-methylcytosine-specific restriction endonuclease McrA